MPLQRTLPCPSAAARRAGLPLLAALGVSALALAVLPLGAAPATAQTAPAAQTHAPVGEQSGRAAGPDELAVLLTFAQTAGQSQALAMLASGPLEEQGAADRQAALLALRPPAAALDAVNGFATLNGLTVAHATSASVLLTGPAGRLARLFGATLTATPAGLRYPLTPPTVPTALQAAVGSVVGLDERPLMHKKAVPGGYTGSTLRSAYKMPSAGSTGAGVTVGLMQFSGWTPGDLTTYASAAGTRLTAGQITEVAVDGADPHALDGSGGDFEVAMDAEAVLATAPAARQRLYFAPNSSAYTVDLVNQMADDAAAGKLQVASSSWGSCEADTDQSIMGPYGQALDRLIAAGATFFAASGDSGSYDCSNGDAPDGRLAVDFPASYPRTVATGGTTLRHPSAGYTETAWGDVRSDAPAGTFAGSGSGGGVSANQPRPAYQQGLKPGGTTRLVPDVSSDADPETGLGVYSQAAGGWVLGGGTSLAAPTWAGFTAAALSSGHRTVGLGNILPALYAHPQAFRDVTTGGNGAYRAGSGFDLVTGLGSPDWTQLTRLLVGAAPKPSPKPSPKR